MSTVLTLSIVRERVEHVLAMDAENGDPEAAHGSQDDLYVAILRAVAAGHPDSAQMATEALRIEESDGVRWYA